MIIGNGNNFRDMLMKSPGVCPKCSANLTFGDAAQLAKSHGIQDNVVMCGRCNRVFEVNLVPGRMSLTNYVTQSIVGSALYYHWGLFLRLGTTESLALGIVLFVLQLAFCRWWMKSHTHGPLEYVWKRLTWLGSGRNAIQK